MTTVTSLFSQLDSTPRSSGATNTNLASDFNNFLNLLTIQLQNQDPLEPLDTNQFTEQIVQMTEVEQTVSMNERLGALIDAQETQRIQTAVDFVGKQVDALGDIVPLGANGAEMFVALPNQASSIVAEIVRLKDSGVDGEVVASVSSLSTDAGVHRLLWDGLDEGGELVDLNDTYRLRVTALNAAGDEINAKVGFSGIAEELRHEDGVLNLMVAGKTVPLDQIVAARVHTFVEATQ